MRLILASLVLAVGVAAGRGGRERRGGHTHDGVLGSRHEEGHGMFACADEKARLCSTVTPESNPEIATKAFMFSGDANADCFDTLYGHYTAGTGDLSEACATSLVARQQQMEQMRERVRSKLAEPAVVEACGAGFCPSLDLRSCLQSADETCKAQFSHSHEGHEGREGQRFQQSGAEHTDRLQLKLSSAEVVAACGENFCPTLDLRTCMQSASEECRTVFMSSHRHFDRSGAVASVQRSAPSMSLGSPRSFGPAQRFSSRAGGPGAGGRHHFG